MSQNYEELFHEQSTYIQELLREIRGLEKVNEDLEKRIESYQLQLQYIEDSE